MWATLCALGSKSELATRRQESIEARRVREVELAEKKKTQRHENERHSVRKQVNVQQNISLLPGAASADVAPCLPSFLRR